LKMNQLWLRSRLSPPVCSVMSQLFSGLKAHQTKRNNLRWDLLLQPFVDRLEISTQSRSPGYRSLHEAIRVLYSAWVSLIWKAPSQWQPKDYTMAIIYNRTRLRCRRVLEHLFRVQSTEVFECIVDWWSRDQNVRFSYLISTLLIFPSYRLHLQTLHSN